jgi:23S rRNA (pseudouridine1915-N3)-methyltransferase
MKILILPIGRIRSKPVAVLAADYAERLSHYATLHVIPCRDEREALSNVKAGDFVVLLDSGGSEQSSEELAKFISGHRMRGTKRLVFFIGGPEGIKKEVRARADHSLSLSRMTFPHELAQAILLEQLYRAHSIIKGEPYHK